MEERIIITCDSGLDIPSRIVKEYNIKVMPILIKMGEELYRDIEDVSPDDIFAWHDKYGELPLSQPPSVEYVANFFTRLVHMGYTVIHFTMTPTISFSYERACTAADIFERVHVFDTAFASIGGVPFVVNAAKMAREGKSVQEILASSEEMKSKIFLHFTVESMDFMLESGKLNAITAMFAKFVRMKPSMCFKNGKIIVDRKYMGNYEKVLTEFIHDIFSESQNTLDTDVLYLAHTCSDAGIIAFVKEEIAKYCQFNEIVQMHMGSIITTHLGRNAIAVTAVKK